jgi:hypothetical protein
MMNAELVSAGEHRIIIPSVYRNNYLMGLRGMSSNQHAAGLITSLDFAQRYTASIDYWDLERARTELTATNAFRESEEEAAGVVRLQLPTYRGSGALSARSGSCQHHSRRGPERRSLRWRAVADTVCVGALGHAMSVYLDVVDRVACCERGSGRCRARSGGRPCQRCPTRCPSVCRCSGRR